MLSDVEACYGLIDEFDEFGQTCSCGFDVFARDFEDFGGLEVVVLGDGLLARLLCLLQLLFALAQFLFEQAVLPLLLFIGEDELPHPCLQDLQVLFFLFGHGQGVLGLLLWRRGL